MIRLGLKQTSVIFVNVVLGFFYPNYLFNSEWHSPLPALFGINFIFTIALMDFSGPTWVLASIGALFKILGSEIVIDFQG